MSPFRKFYVLNGLSVYCEISNSQGVNFRISLFYSRLISYFSNLKLLIEIINNHDLKKGI